MFGSCHAERTGFSLVSVWFYFVLDDGSVSHSLYQ